MKISELKGTELDYWVAKAQGWKLDCCGRWMHGDQYRIEKAYYTPTTNDAQAFKLIDLYEVELYLRADGREAYITGPNKIWFGRDARTAVCRAVVASEFGEEVSDD